MAKAKKVNTRWFTDKLTEQGYSMRRLAALLDLDPSAVSLMLRGMRKMTPGEAAQISGIIRVPVTEVLRQAGIRVLDDAHEIPQHGWVDASGIVQKNIGPSRLFSVPADVPTNGMAVQVRGANLPNDGWVVFTGPYDDRVAFLLDRVALVKLKNGQQVLGTVRRGSQEELHHVSPFTGGAVIENAKVSAIAPVLWIKPT